VKAKQIGKIRYLCYKLFAKIDAAFLGKKPPFNGIIRLLLSCVCGEEDVDLGLETEGRC